MSNNRESRVLEKWIIDELVGELVRVEREKGEMLSLPRSLLPLGCSEGDVLEVHLLTSSSEEQSLVEIVRTNDGEDRREMLREMRSRLETRDQSGDLVL